ncbi:MAG: hypothetical protein J6J83_03140 [Oscillospiraceae bacterium]|nr:hypothetical protein [Oscillospiraceae bacterium]
MVHLVLYAVWTKKQPFSVKILRIAENRRNTLYFGAFFGIVWLDRGMLVSFAADIMPGMMQVYEQGGAARERSQGRKAA